MIAPGVRVIADLPTQATVESVDGEYATVTWTTGDGVLERQMVHLSQLKEPEFDAEMTTDPEEGRRQIEAMKPEPLKVGDKVRLAAGGERVFRVAEPQDYGNMIECEWYEPLGVGDAVARRFDVFPVSSLVLVEAP